MMTIDELWSYSVLSVGEKPPVSKKRRGQPSFGKATEGRPGDLIQGDATLPLAVPVSRP